VASLLRRVFFLVVGLLLAALLVFLYFKTQTVDLRKQNEIVGLLRQMKEIDSRWNGELLRARADPSVADIRADDIFASLRRAQQELLSASQGLSSEGVGTAVSGVLAAFDEKRELIARFEGERAKARIALDSLAPVAIPIRAMRDGAPDARVRARIELLADQIESLRTQALQYLRMHDAASRDALTTTSGQLQEIANGVPAALQLLPKIAPALEVVRQQGPLLERLSHQLDILPLVPRIDTLAFTFEREFQVLADEKERYRIYLVAYSAALLVFLGWVGLQLRVSYRKIAQVNVQLVTANETLERRVEERTHELSGTLKKLKESQLLLVQSEKMSSLGQMVAGITHEINTPLAYVKSSLELVQNKLPEMSELIDSLEQLLRMLAAGTTAEQELNAQFSHVSSLADALREHETVKELGSMLGDGLHGIEQITEIVTSLKNFSRIDRSKVSRFSLNEGLDSALVIARNLVKTKTVIKNYGDIPPVECSPSQINQVFLNLITNAAQAIPDKSGTITLRTSRSGDQVKVEVADNGHGIPKDVLPKIFDPFFTTKEIGQGTGLGLSIAYKIVSEHGGKISVRSELDKGTVFTVLLPLKPSIIEAQTA
jgi:two-component system, NtrC family, sensor kinase